MLAMAEILSILYHDENFVAINKPSGLLVHRSAIDRHETRLAVQILRDQLNQPVFPVHRLDKPTSGVLLFALSASAARAMGDIFAQQQVAKTYLAIVRGHAPTEGVIDHPLQEERDRCSDKKMRTEKPAQPALTHYRTRATIELDFAVDKYPRSRYSLVECQPKTGRKHQLRRHLKHINHPIIGDAKHGKSRHNYFFQTQFSAHRLLLAATELTFTHPFSQAQLTICAPLDACFQSLLQEFTWCDKVPPPWLTSTSPLSLTKTI